LKKIIIIVLKSEMSQFFWDNIFLQMAQLRYDGGSNNLYNKYFIFKYTVTWGTWGVVDDLL
jgi:hypothetical protein